MSETIIISLITSITTIFSVIITGVLTYLQSQTKLNSRLDSIEKQLDKINTEIKKIQPLETRTIILDERIKNLTRPAPASTVKFESQSPRLRHVKSQPRVAKHQQKKP